MTISKELIEQMKAVFSRLLACFAATDAPISQPLPPQPPPSTQNPAPEPPKNATLLWDTPQNTRHSCRVIMDQYELTWDEKDLLCAVIEAESGFNIHATHKNNNGSSDFGLVQMNSTYWVGPGKYFSSVQEVFDDPAKSVRFMIESYKSGHLNRWYAYTNKSYLKYMPKK